MEYWRLQDQDDLESLHIVTKGKARRLWKLYQELVIKRGMSLEAITNVIDIALNRLPGMEHLLDQAIRSAARKQEKVEYLEKCIRTLEEEEKKKIMITLPSSYYHVDDRENPAMKVFSSNIRQPSQLPYWPTEDFDHGVNISLNSNQSIVKSFLSTEMVIVLQV